MRLTPIMSGAIRRGSRRRARYPRRAERTARRPRRRAESARDLVGRPRQHDDLRRPYARACSRRTRTRAGRPVRRGRRRRRRPRAGRGEALVALTPRNATTIVPAAHGASRGERGGRDHGGAGRRGGQRAHERGGDLTCRRRPRSRRWHRRCRAVAPSMLAARRGLSAAAGPRSGRGSSSRWRPRGRTRDRLSPTTATRGARRRRARERRLLRKLPAAQQFELGPERVTARHAGRARCARALLDGAPAPDAIAREIDRLFLAYRATPPDGVLFTGYYLPALAARATRDAALPVSGARPPARSRDRRDRRIRRDRLPAEIAGRVEGPPAPLLHPRRDRGRRGRRRAGARVGRRSDRALLPTDAGLRHADVSERHAQSASRDRTGTRTSASASCSSRRASSAPTPRRCRASALARRPSRGGDARAEREPALHLLPRARRPAVGSLGVPLTAGRTIATDPAIYPPGVLA